MLVELIKFLAEGFDFIVIFVKLGFKRKGFCSFWILCDFLAYLLERSSSIVMLLFIS